MKVYYEISRRRDLTGNAKLVWSHIQNLQGDNGYAWSGIRSIAKECGICLDTAIEAIRVLEERGLLIADRRPKRTTRYQIVDSSVRETSTDEPDKNCSEKPTSCTENPNQTDRKTRTELYGFSERKRTRTIKRTNKRTKGVTWESTLETLSSNSALRTEEFRGTWEDWIADRRDRGKSITERAAKMQLKKLEDMGHDRAIKSIEQSIQNGWIGIFEPGRSVGGRTKHSRIDAPPGKYDFFDSPEYTKQFESDEPEAGNDVSAAEKEAGCADDPQDNSTEPK